MNTSTYGLQTRRYKYTSNFGQLNSLLAVLMLLVYRKYCLVNPYANGLREVGIDVGYNGLSGGVKLALRMQ
jgi:hypothetical protein